MIVYLVFKISARMDLKSLELGSGFYKASTPVIHNRPKILSLSFSHFSEGRGWNQVFSDQIRETSDQLRPITIPSPRSDPTRELFI